MSGRLTEKIKTGEVQTSSFTLKNRGSGPVNLREDTTIRQVHVANRTYILAIGITFNVNL